MKIVRKYLDWRGWLRGLYLNWIKALTSTLLTYAGTNALNEVGVNIGITWKQALAMVASVTIVEILRYLNSKPEPEEITETDETQTP